MSLVVRRVSLDLSRVSLDLSSLSLGCVFVFRREYPWFTSAVARTGSFNDWFCCVLPYKTINTNVVDVNIDAGLAKSLEAFFETTDDLYFSKIVAFYFSQCCFWWRPGTDMPRS